MKKQKSASEVARENEREVLLAITLVGWLTTTQVASWLWPGRNAHQARNKAAITCKRLEERGALLRRVLVSGAHAFILTKAGAQEVNTMAGREVCRPGYDLGTLDEYKQRMTVEYLTEERNSGRVAIGGNGLRNDAVKSLTDVRPKLKDADGVAVDDDGTVTAALVVRSVSPALVKRAVRVKSAADVLRFLGEPKRVKLMEREMRKLSREGSER